MIKKSVMKLFTGLSLVILLNLIFSCITNLPQNVGEDVPAGKLNSLSFAPFRDGHDPMQGLFPSDKQLEEDLALMGNITHNIRTYASAEGNMSKIPDLAKKYGLTLLQGGWLGALKSDNDIEIAELIRSANAHPDVVTRVMVGNEVLLRGDLKPQELIEYIRQVKHAVKQPVSYADVWSMYMKYPELIKEVDFITIHILPYWEDEPISVTEAPRHIERIYKQVQQEAQLIAPSKPILIGESGWPSGGKQRGVAVPSVVNEAKFIRDFIKVANTNGFDYNIVEAFNQPWKAAFEGIIGAKWGLYDSSRQPVFPLTGKVIENPKAYQNTITSVILFLIIVILFRKSLNELNTIRFMSFLVITQILSVLLVSQGVTLWQTSYTDFQRLQTVFILSFNIGFGYFLVQRILFVLRKHSPPPELAQRLYFGIVLVIIYALLKTVLLSWDGRYIMFPIIVTQLAVFSLVALALINYFLEKMSLTESMSLTGLLDYKQPTLLYIKQVRYSVASIAVFLMIGEGYSFMASRDFIMAYPAIVSRLSMATLFTVINGQLLTWLASLAVLVSPFFVCGNTRKVVNSGIV